MKDLLLPGSDIRIDAEGLWHYRGAEMTRREIVRLFYRNLSQDERGAYSIKSGPQVYPIQVEDTAYVVWSVRYAQGENDAGDCIYLLLSDDSVERLDPKTLRIGKNNVPYCKIRNNRFEARFSKHSYYQLAEYIQYNPEKDSYFIALNSIHYYIADI